MKKHLPLLSIASFLTAGTLAHSALAADIAVVIDDSKGMCGYLHGDSAFKATLRKLQMEVEKSNASVSFYRLSQLADGSGTTGSKAIADFSKVISSNSCDLKAPTSPLHLVHSKHLENKTLLILVSDMVFDEGSAGGVESRVKFVDGAAAWASASARTKPPALESYFSSGMGIIGKKSNFTGSYFPSNGGSSIQLKDAERPFYIFWKSTNNKFSFPILKPLVDDKSGIALDFFPTPSSFNKFEYNIPKFTVDLLKETPDTTVFYRYENPSSVPAADSILSEKCFKRKGTDIDFNVRCDAETYDDDRYIFAVRGSTLTKDLRGAELWIPAPSLSGVEQKLKRVPTSKPSGTAILYTTLKGKAGNERNAAACGLNDFLCLYPKNNIGAIAKTALPSRYLRISVRPSDRIFDRLGREDAVKNNSEVQISEWQDVFSEIPSNELHEQIEKQVSQWSSDSDLCPARSQCNDTLKGTVGFSNFALSMTSKIDASKRATDLLNKEGDFPKYKFKLTIKRVAGVQR